MDKDFGSDYLLRFISSRLGHAIRMPGCGATSILSPLQYALIRWKGCRYQEHVADGLKRVTDGEQ